MDLKKGCIHGLLGENGAGKSTLVKMMGGVVRPDEGEIAWEGESVKIRSPLEGRRLGIGMVFQHFSLFDALTVSENVVLGLPPDWHEGEVDEEIKRVSEIYGLEVDPKKDVYSLTVGERQRVEIVRCLLQNPKLLIMDEPTSVLTPQEADRLIEVLVRLAGEGCGILYISHRLAEVEEMCDEATIMRHGEVVARVVPKEEKAVLMASKMMGGSYEKRTREGLVKWDVGSDVVLSMEGVNCDLRPEYGVRLRDVHMEVRSGEIVGIAGLAGNGQDLLGSVLSGEVLLEEGGLIKFFGEEVGGIGVVGRRRMGMGYIPEDRQGHSALLNFDLVGNGVLGSDSYEGLWRGSWLQKDKARDFAEGIVKEYDVRCPGVDHQASSLSGGNLQKFVMGRVLKQRPKLVIAMQPTWGLDVGAASLIHGYLIDLAREGCGIILVSQELDELMTLTHRLGVLSEGCMSKFYPTGEIKEEEVGLLMGGLDKDFAEEVKLC
jgi:simple sugar transport system ATP-binding protein